MGAAMRRQCCGGRDDADVKSTAREIDHEGLAFLAGTGGKNDLALFDEAYETNDIATLVKLIDSDQPFSRSNAPVHPWADLPRTVGTLAALHIGAIVSRDEPARDRIRAAGGIPKLVKHLSSKEDDRKHASVVALSFLAIDNTPNCTAMFDAGAIPLLIECMKTPPEGLMAASADAARNIFCLDVLYRQEFVKHGGVRALVALLDLPTGGYDPEKLYNQSEAVFHIEDLILDDGVELPQFVKAVKDAGAVKRLEELTNVKNEALSADARSLLERLAG